MPRAKPRCARCDEVTFDLHAGELALLVGPSGSGKTTLLSIMGCILRPTAGTLSVLGDDVARLAERDLPAIRRERIGFIFQSFNLFPTLTTLQNVALALDLRGVAGRVARDRAAALLDQVGLGSKHGAYPAESERRAEAARGHRPRARRAIRAIILADEPTAALDSQAGRTVMDLLQRLARERGRAVAIVTHDNRMLGYGDRLVKMEDGRLVSDERQPVLQGAVA